MANKCRKRYDHSEPSSQLAEAFQTAYSLSEDSGSNWYLDNGASAHMTPDANALATSENYVDKDSIIVSNGTSLPITHTNTLSPSPNIQLLDVLVVPDLTKYLLSISKLTFNFSLSVTLTNSCFTIQNKAIG